MHICVFTCTQAATTLHTTLKGHHDSVLCVAISGDCAFMASGGADTTVKLWDVDQHMCTLTLDTVHKWGVLGIDISEDGIVIASCGLDKTIKVWQLSLHVTTPAEEPRTLTEHSDYVWCVKISPDATKLASCSADGTVRIWSVQTGELLQTFEGHEGWVRSVAWSPDSRLVASAGWYDKTVRVWNVVGGTQVTQPLTSHGQAVTCVAWGSRNASLFASCGFDKNIIVWDLQGGSATVKHTLQGHTDILWSVSLSPDDRFVVSGSADSVWGVAAGQPVRVLEGHAGDVNTVAWSRDGKYIVSGSEDKTVRVWEVDAQVCVCVYLCTYMSICMSAHVCMFVCVHSNHIYCVCEHKSPIKHVCVCVFVLVFECGTHVRMCTCV